MASNNREREELTYANFSVTHQGTPYPLTEGSLVSKFSQYQYELLQEDGGGLPQRYVWSAFLKNCLIEIKIFEPNTTNILVYVSPKIYETSSQLLGKINSVIPRVGSSIEGDCQIKVFNYIDRSVPCIEKIYGYNHFYTSLVGTSKLIKTPYFGHNLIFDTHFPERENFVRQAWEHVWGRTVTSAEYNADPDNWNATIWFQVNKQKNLYRLPAINVGTGTKCGGFTTGRQCWDESSSSLVTAVQDSIFRFENTKVSVIYSGGASSGMDWDITSYKTTQNPQDHSAIAIYGVLYGDQKAIYVKPLGGIDKWLIPKFDENLFRLEARFTRPGKRARWKIIDISSDTGDASGHDTYTNRIGKDKLWLGGYSQANYKEISSQDTGWNVHLYLRRLGTEYVSELSTSYISANFIGRNKFSSLTYLIQNN